MTTAIYNKSTRYIRDAETAKMNAQRAIIAANDRFIKDQFNNGEITSNECINLMRRNFMYQSVSTANGE